jgi:CPA2 family monovalent cation:H+ antiporter-2
MVMGFVASRLKMPPLVGYLIAGIVIGPATPGFVADVGLASQLADIGVMLLMFGVGLHFSLDDLLAVRRIVVPGAVVVVLRALESGRALQSINGRIAIGWLIVEDLVMVLVLVLLPPLGQVLGDDQHRAAAEPATSNLWIALSFTPGKVLAFVAFMLVVGRRVLPRILWLVARTGSRELFTLCVISAAVGVLTYRPPYSMFPSLSAPSSRA